MIVLHSASPFREDFWTPGHNQLFRICESDSTSRKPFQVHTCNVFRPNYNLNNAPLHAFVESVRPWSTLSASELPGQARRIDPIRLDALLLTYGLKCSKNNTTSTQSITKDDSDDSQIIIGGVGQSFKSRKYAIACNYFTKDGSLSHDFCARYNDGGIKSIGKSRPLSINGIMEKHFGMTCEWVVRDLGFVV